MNKLLPATLLVGCLSLLAFAFILPSSNDAQLAAIASAQTSGFTFKQSILGVEEGQKVNITVIAPANLTKTTRVPIQVQSGSAKSGTDFNGGTKYLTFYRGGLKSKTVTIQTNTDRTQESAETFTVKIPGSSELVTVTLVEKGTQSSTNGSVLAGNNTNTSVTTTPSDCSLYSGIIPGETKKVSVMQKGFPQVVYNAEYGLSAEGKKDLDLMQGDIGYQLTFGPRGPGNWNTVTIPSGTAYAYKFKTTEYNFPVYYRLSLSDKPATTGGVVVTSISECPGDFTSPQVMAQTTGHDEYNTGNTVGDQKFRNCVTYGRPLNAGGGIEFGIGGNTQYICALQPNKTYYINISAGFAGGGDKGHTTPHIGTFDGTTAGTEMTADFTMSPFGHLQAVGNIGNKLWNTDLIKNRTAFYTEARRISGLFQAAAQQRVAACRAAITANTGPRTGRECANLSTPTPEYTFQ